MKNQMKNVFWGNQIFTKFYLAMSDFCQSGSFLESTSLSVSISLLCSSSGDTDRSWGWRTEPLLSSSFHHWKIFTKIQKILNNIILHNYESTFLSTKFQDRSTLALRKMLNISKHSKNNDNDTIWPFSLTIVFAP